MRPEPPFRCTRPGCRYLCRDLLIHFEPQPLATEVPQRMPDPFDPVPHPLAQRAAHSFMEKLAHEDPFPMRAFAGKHGGKMMGVLVVRETKGLVGYLRGFSGAMEGQWSLPGYVPPLFDVQTRHDWPAAVVQLDAMSAQLEDLRRGPMTVRLRLELAELQLRGRSPLVRSEREARKRALAELEKKGQRIRDERRARSSEILAQFLDSYVVVNARGERQALQHLFAPKPPPGGAGDCAAPKLFAYAFAHNLQPLALAEFWWGLPPASGLRQPRSFYPACSDKCGPILGFMLT